MSGENNPRDLRGLRARRRAAILAHREYLASSDAWLDTYPTAQEPGQERSRWRPRFAGWFAGPWERARNVTSFLGTTPGRMIAITLVLCLAIGAAGYSMSQSSANRQSELNVLLEETEPLSYSAHNLYTNLSMADTIATGRFVRAGIDTDESLGAYFEAIDRASLAATNTAAGIPKSDPRVGQLVASIQRELPIYTGMVETARANSRSGNPVGVTYMANASSLMREQILPAAAELFDLTSKRVAAEQQRLSNPQWVPLSGLFAAVFFLLLAQWWLWRVTRRRLNRGFLLATILMASAILWVGVSNFATWQSGHKGFDEASRPFDALTASRIDAQKARTTETLALVNRDTLATSRGDYGTMIEEVSVALDNVDRSAADAEKDGNNGSWGGDPQRTHQLVKNARGALTDWSNAHDRLVAALQNGNYDAASRIAASDPTETENNDGSVGSYARLDQALNQLISSSRDSMRSFMSDGLEATKMVSTAVMILAVASIIVILLGIRPRLQEYL